MDACGYLDLFFMVASVLELWPLKYFLSVGLATSASILSCRNHQGCLYIPSRARSIYLEGIRISNLE